MRADLDGVRQRLGGSGASRRAAQAVLDVASGGLGAAPLTPPRVWASRSARGREILSGRGRAGRDHAPAVRRIWPSDRFAGPRPRAEHDSRRSHMSLNSFATRQTLTVGGETVDFYSLPALERAGFPGVVRGCRSR